MDKDRQKTGITAEAEHSLEIARRNAGVAQVAILEDMAPHGFSSMPDILAAYREGNLGQTDKTRVMRSLRAFSAVADPESELLPVIKTEEDVGDVVDCVMTYGASAGKILELAKKGDSMSAVSGLYALREIINSQDKAISVSLTALTATLEDSGIDVNSSVFTDDVEAVAVWLESTGRLDLRQPSRRKKTLRSLGGIAGEVTEALADEFNDLNPSDYREEPDEDDQLTQARRYERVRLPSDKLKDEELRTVTSDKIDRTSPQVEEIDIEDYDSLLTAARDITARKIYPPSAKA